ncbi:hypothetical protein [Acinetobacter calcoaceticus]
MKDWIFFDEIIIEKNEDIYFVLAVDNSTGKKYQINILDVQRYEYIGSEKVCFIEQKNGYNLRYNGKNHKEMFEKLPVLLNAAETRTYSISSPENVHNKKKV